jgi:hypothetical protein
MSLDPETPDDPTEPLTTGMEALTKNLSDYMASLTARVDLALPQIEQALRAAKVREALTRPDFAELDARTKGFYGG